MQTRKLLPLLLLSLLAACSHTAPSGPAAATQSPYLPIEDLVKPSATQPTIAAQEHDRQVHELIDLITASISPTTWKSIQYPDSPTPIINPAATATGTISYDPKGLLITQSPEVKAEVIALLQILRQDESLQVSIECRFILVPPHFLDGMDPDPTTHDHILDSFTARLLLRNAQLENSTTTLSAPHVTVTSGQTAHVGVTTTSGIRTGITPGVPATAPVAIISAPTVNIIPISDSITIDITPTISADRRYIRLQIADPKNPTDITIPDGQTLLLRTRKIVDPDAATNPPSTNPANDRLLLILLRPKILIHHEIEVDRFGHPYDAPHTLIPIGIAPVAAPTPPAKP